MYTHAILGYAYNIDQDLSSHFAVFFFNIFSKNVKEKEKNYPLQEAASSSPRKRLLFGERVTKDVNEGAMGSRSWWCIYEVTRTPKMGF